MKKDDLLIVLLAIFLILAMIITYFIGGERSRHGVGFMNYQYLSAYYTDIS